MSDIFLSYAREDRSKAAALVSILEARRWSVFWDSRIPAGAVFDDLIEAELDAARCVVVLWSAASAGSQWVRAEAAEGADRNRLVSVLLEDVRVPIAFRRIQAANLVGWSGETDCEGLRGLLHSIAPLVQTASISPQPEAKPLDAAALHRIEARLAEFVGPVAASLLHACSSRATGLANLCDLLAREIPAGPQRTSFMHRCHAEFEALSGPESARWDEEFLAHLVNDLTAFVGPVARIVVRRAAAKAASAGELYELVAREIPRDMDREAFLRSRRT